LFDGGRGGQAFGAMYDQQLAEHMARGVGQKLVKSIVRQLEARKAYERAHPAERRQDRPVAGESSKDVRNHVTPGLRA
jgi:Rod binding domain-containing protein